MFSNITGKAPVFAGPFCYNVFMGALANEWYRKSSADAVSELGSDATIGLSQDEARARLAESGPNMLPEPRRRSVAERIARELQSPLVFTLFAAGVVTAFLGEYIDATVITLALCANLGIGLYQEGRAGKAFEKLKNSQASNATVVRGGKKSVIPSEGLVVGDLLVLESGMKIAADARLVVAQNLSTSEAALSGEWMEVEKDSEPRDTTLPVTERGNMVFMGTLASGGSGRAVVVATGEATEFGAIARSLRSGTEPPPTPLQENAARIARLLTQIVIGTLVVIFALGLWRGESWTHLLLVSIAVAVAAIPEGLPAAVTVVLALGMEAILRRGGLVRNLLAAETLGSTTVILTDKTGTLTKADMRVVKVVTWGSVAASVARGDEHLVHEAHGDERDTLQFAALASDAFIERDGGSEGAVGAVRGRPVERAVVLAALESGIDQGELLRQYPRIDFLPFSSRERIAASLHQILGLKRKRLYVTGAPEHLLSCAGAVYWEGKTKIKSKELQTIFEKVLHSYTSEGKRLIGVAYRNVSLDAFPKDSEVSRRDLLNGIVFAGFIVLDDPVREDAPVAIAQARAAGVRVMMATGDNIETARAVGRACGIYHDGDVAMSGIDIDGLKDDALLLRLANVSVLARMLPEHKLRVVRVLAASGETVAMTGDGVNDAPALQAASIGIALGSGTEVAKESSDLILQHDGFAVIVAAMEEGRRIVDNLRKVVAYLLATSFGEVALVGGALLLAFPLPLLPGQILWTNMLTEGFMNFAFAFEPKESDLMRRDPRRESARTMLSRRLVRFILLAGVISGGVLMIFFAYLTRNSSVSEEEARTFTFIALTLAAVATSFSLKDLRAPLWSVRIGSNTKLLGAVCFAIAGLIIALEWTPLRDLLALQPVALQTELPALAAVVLVTVFGTEIAKYFVFPRRNEA